MKPLDLLNEQDIKRFLKAGTVQDVETCMNSLIMTRKLLDRDTNIERIYYVKLQDKAEGYSYEVASNAIGLEAIRVLTYKHNIKDGGSESENSLFISFYSEEA